MTVKQQIAEKKKEAESYQDQGCYNAAYAYGYAAGAHWVFEHIFDAVLQKLPTMEEADFSTVFCQCGDEILSQDEAALNHLADAFELMDVAVVTGYYDPEDDERNDEVDALTGYHYLAL